VKIKGAVLREANKPYSIEELELDSPHEEEVLVKWLYTGYCHSDLSNAKGRTMMVMPMVAGHECAGVVAGVGNGVTKFKEGDHVVGTWMVPCGHCPECRKGMGNICTGTFGPFVNGTMLDGTSRIKDMNGDTVLHGNFVSGFSTYTVVPEGGLVNIRKDMPLDQACLMSCCIPTGWGTVTKRANVQPQDRVAIWGLGGVGQNTLRACAVRGANPLIVVDLEESRRDKAMKLGATHFICNSKEDPIPLIQQLTDGGVDFAFETAGQCGAAEQAFWALRMNGKLMQVGICPQQEPAKIPLTFTVFHHKDVIGTLYGGVSVQDDIPKLIERAMAGELMIDTIIEGYFKLDELNDIAEKMERRELGGRWICKLEES
jgi:Zn-dependent alcohol dehydrogenase